MPKISIGKEKHDFCQTIKKKKKTFSIIELLKHTIVKQNQ